MLIVLYFFLGLLEEQIHKSKSYVGNVVNKFKREVAKELVCLGIKGEEVLKWI